MNYQYVMSNENTVLAFFFFNLINVFGSDINKMI